MKREAFERLVAQALEALPKSFRDKLDNVEIVVEDWPDPDTMWRVGARHPTQLLGFYHGIPQTRRTHSYGLVLPDKITLYQGPIEIRCHTVEQVQALIQHVLQHELAHHFGSDDERLQEIGAY